MHCVAVKRSAAEQAWTAEVEPPDGVCAPGWMQGGHVHSAVAPQPRVAERGDRLPGSERMQAPRREAIPGKGRSWVHEMETMPEH